MGLPFTQHVTDDWEGSPAIYKEDCVESLSRRSIASLHVSVTTSSTSSLLSLLLGLSLYVPVHIVVVVLSSY